MGRLAKEVQGGKMKVKVIESYVDKHTFEFCGVGEVKDYPKERAEELISLNLVTKYKAPRSPEKVTVKKDSIS